MKIAFFHTGLHLTLNSALYRIDRMLATGECYLERLSDHAILFKTKKELTAHFTSGELQLVGEESRRTSEISNFRTNTDLAGLPESEQKVVLRRFEYVSEAHRLLGGSPTKKNVEEVIRRVCERLDDSAPPKVPTVYKWWSLWVRSGNNLVSLANKRPGATGTRRFRGTVEAELQKVIEDVFLKRQKPSKQQVFDHFRHRMAQLNTARLHPLPIPSRAQFYRMLSKIDKYDVMAAREGKQAAERHFRATGAGVVTKHILERVEVDHTPLDLIVLNEKTGLADGRPTLTLLLDHCSRMPLGFEIGFEPPSELSVMRALRNAILPKALSGQLLSEVEKDWPAFGIPSTLICDNGLEFHSHQLRRMCCELNIELQFCPKQKPHYKGAVERFLGTLNRAVCHRIPGTTFSNIKARGSYSSVDNARLTMRELESLIHQWIIDIYCHQVHSSTHRTPFALWMEGLTTIEPLLPESLLTRHPYRSAMLRT